MASVAPHSPELITAQELADLVGESYHAIDHWTKASLLVPKRRGRTRLYEPKESAERCRRIRSLQEEGHNLLTIKGFLNGR
jgi:DNA-binding transcriptional MerR regulator